MLRILIRGLPELPQLAETEIRLNVIATILTVPELKIEKSRIECKIHHHFKNRPTEQITINAAFDPRYENRAPLLEKVCRKLTGILKIRFPNRQVVCLIKILKTAHVKKCAE